MLIGPASMGVEVAATAPFLNELNISVGLGSFAGVTRLCTNDPRPGSGHLCKLAVPRRTPPPSLPTPRVHEGPQRDLNEYKFGGDDGRTSANQS
ncbi:hypothetical protein GCM10010052_41980 [Paenarthrobacter histidinolovorans]|nr:hypothetical protein GCM10010052_41980 [Paenarthrobacter histidinolovorans]